MEYYVLVDLSFTPIKMNPDHMMNNSLTVFWIKTTTLPTSLKRVSLIVLDSNGLVLKSVWPKKVVRVSGVVLDIFKRSALNSKSWNWKELLKYSNARARILRYYGSRESYLGRIQCLPELNNSLYNIC